MATHPEPLQGLRVLIVEDETLIAEELRDRLTRLGLSVVDLVVTGEQAIQSAERHRPDLVLMDIRIKGTMDGIQAAEAIRRLMPTPVVFLTAHSDEETVRRAKGAEPFGYVLKPFQERELTVALEMALHRHRLERRLKESEQKYVATLASIGDGVIATDVEGRVTFLNPVAEALTQWRLTDALGVGVEEVFPVAVEATGEPRENPALEAMRRREVVHLMEAMKLSTRNGEVIPIDDSAAPITDDHGKLLGAVVAFRDIRQRRLAQDALKQAEEQLRHAQKMEAIGRLTGGVAHDFNNLLTVINGCSDILLQDSRLELTARELLAEIRQAGERASGLTRNLLSFSRKQPVQPVAVDLGKLATESSRMLERLIGPEVTLVTLADPSLWPIRADPGQMEQVIMNLAVNARDAMPRGGQLMIEARNVAPGEGQSEAGAGRQVLLAVSDTGVGMDEATRERAFDPFFTTKEPGKGTGLGLATVYGIVKQLDGAIYLRSAPGEGTTFKLYFPALPGAVMPAADPGIWPAAGGNETVLLVEGDDAVRSLVSSTLRTRGYTVYEASNGEEALAVFTGRIGEIQAILMEMVLPGLSCRELREKVRTANPEVRILYLSSYPVDPKEGLVGRPGHEAHLFKPFTPSVLAAKLRELLG